MHELGLVYQIVRTVDDIKEEQKLTDIDSIVLSIGEMNDVVPMLIKEAWEAIVPNTSYPNAKLDMQIVPAVAKCRKCGYSDRVKNIDMECPRCSSMDFSIVSGREFLIEEIKAK